MKSHNAKLRGFQQNNCCFNVLDKDPQFFLFIISNSQHTIIVYIFFEDKISCFKYSLSFFRNSGLNLSRVCIRVFHCMAYTKDRGKRYTARDLVSWATAVFYRLFISHCDREHYHSRVVSVSPFIAKKDPYKPHLHRLLF